ncbi:DUF1801 domain-containing protein [Hyalangium rubrum]|uniref:DUF1801 domain-containing protein n=1 Tax=Hyalangium rubrum TaxID=3103134 RepID=A0ABU5HHW0_9BACT|nr:DUF1801 domain-containing protein [Hyalangium sp. s54d21]MDY7232831.1 DUF1801 domain-containing protein [Hyalangium sp. s54d21]
MNAPDDEPVVHIQDLLSNALQQTACLIVLSARSVEGIGRMLRLDRSETVLGRSSEAQFQLEDDGISRKHAKVLMLGVILEADPEMTEEWKWSTPVWSHHGIVCTGEAYAKVVKLTFARGARLPVPSRLFNSSLEGNTRRAIDIREGEKVDARAFKALVKSAVAQNGSPAKKR